MSVKHFYGTQWIPNWLSIDLYSLRQPLGIYRDDFFDCRNN
uniref:Macaca fascicularis brain cDNA, clone: QtrA-16040 n=1 Tax=Macaca fascicularis TaxID=9541 RepID=I7GPG2_MACFA|nr:unnamed protein product [Macaca fascicularis]